MPVLLVLTIIVADTEPLALMPLRGRRVPKDVVPVLDTILANELSRIYDGPVVSPEDLEALLDVEQLKDAMGCDDVRCAAEIGGALGTKLLVSGNVSRLGNELIVQLSLIDTVSLTTVARSQVTVENSEPLYLDAIRKASSELFAEIQSARSQVPPRKSVARVPNKPVEIVPDYTASFYLEPASLTVTAKDGAGRTIRCSKAESDVCSVRDLAKGPATATIEAALYEAIQIPLNPRTGMDQLFVVEKDSGRSLLKRSLTWGGLAVAVAGTALLALAWTDEDTATGEDFREDARFYPGLGASAVGGGLTILGVGLHDRLVVEERRPEGS